MRLPWGRLQRLGAVALLLTSAGFLVFRGANSPAISFVNQDPAAPWIMPPAPVSAELQQWGLARVPVTSFARVITLTPSEGGVSPVTLHIRAMRGFMVGVNGAQVEGGHDDGAKWRDERSLDLTDYLHVGENGIRVDIANPRGPALLSLRIEGLAAPVRSDTSWGVWLDERPLGRALLADDTRRHPATLSVETPLEALVAKRDALLVFFTLGLLGYFVALRLPSTGVVRALPGAIIGAVAAAWIALFVVKFLPLPSEIGFDARHHLQYVTWLQANRGVPFATDGWSVYHPPFFYAVAAIFQRIGAALGGVEGANFGIKVVPFLAGFANVWIAAALCRRLLPDDRRTRLVSLVFAAVLPMNLYAAAYFSNETFHTSLAGLAVLATVDLMLAPTSRLRRVFSLGLLIGLGLLTKYTAVIVGAVAAFFVIIKLVAVERASRAGVGSRLILLAAPPAVLAGWFYVRNVLLFGDPLIANWGDMPGSTLKWWQQPGFHTASFYLSFGEALTHPYLAAFRSFWDSLYSTLWGDGGIAGRVDPAQRHPFWNYEFMSASYLLAIPAMGLAAFGAVRSIGTALRDADASRRAAFSFIVTLSYAIGFGLLYMSLRLPYFAQAKASYGLVVMAPFTVYFTVGMTWLDDRLAVRGWHVARAAVYGWFVAFAASCFLAFAG